MVLAATMHIGGGFATNASNETLSGGADDTHWGSARNIWARLADRTVGAVILGGGQLAEFVVDQILFVLESSCPPGGAVCLVVLYSARTVLCAATQGVPAAA